MAVDSVKKVSHSQQRPELFRSHNRGSGLLLKKLVEVEFQHLAADFALPADTVEGAHYLLNTLATLADRMLYFLVEWAKSVPGYSGLAMTSQRGLLEQCYFDQMLLGIAFHSMQVPAGQVQLAADMIFTHGAIVELCGGKLSRCEDELFGVCDAFKSTNVSLYELVVLKAILLLFSDVTLDGRDQQFLGSLQDKVLDCLAYAIHETFTGPDGTSYTDTDSNLDECMGQRQASLLLLLSRVKRLSGWIFV
jgi:hypothetical protein